MTLFDPQQVMASGMSFGPWLQQTRKAHDLTREEFAEAISCSSSTIYKIESGVQRPSKNLAELIARYWSIASADVAAFVQFARGTLTAAPPAPAVAPPPVPALPSALPTPLTPLVGRQPQVERGCALLTAAGVRLLTLSGAGGIGKTRLALAIAQQLRAHFPDGVLFVPLAALRDPDDVPMTLVRSLGLQLGPGQTALLQLKRWCASRSLLLVLDNFEHLLPAAPVLVELLAAAPELRLLVTSRTRLRLSGEHLLVVPPLEVPPADLALAPDSVASVPAVALFVERVQSIDTRFSLSAANLAQVALICRQLEGNPLALELAAARVRVLSLRLLVDRLGQRLSLLTNGPIDLPERHQSVRATLQWSYDLLTPSAQRLLHLLSLFAGGARLDALAAVWAAQPVELPPPTAALAPQLLLEPPMPLLDDLEVLLDNHLVERSTAVAGTLRFALLESIREFALEQQPASGDEQALRHAMLSFYVGLLLCAESALHGPQQLLWLELLEQEHATLRELLRWSIDQQLGPQALRLSSRLGWFWSTHSHLAEGRRWLEQALALPSPPAERIAALNAAGRLACDQGDYAAAAHMLGEARQLAEQSADQSGLAQALDILGVVERSRGNYAAAQELLLASSALFAQLDDRLGLALTANNLGIVARAGGDAAAAQHWYSASLAHFRALGDLQGVAMVLNNLGVLARHQARYTEAAASYHEARTLFQQLADRRGSALTSSNLGRIAQEQGDLDQAQALYLAASADFDLIGDQLGVAHCANLLGGIALAHGELHVARTRYCESLRMCLELGVKQGVLAGFEGLFDAAQRADSAEQRAWMAVASERVVALLELPELPEPLAAFLATMDQQLYQQLASTIATCDLQQLVTLACRP